MRTLSHLSICVLLTSICLVGCVGEEHPIHGTYTLIQADGQRLPAYEDDVEWFDSGTLEILEDGSFHVQNEGQVDGGRPEPIDGEWLISGVGGLMIVTFSLSGKEYYGELVDGYLTMNFDYDGEWVWEKDR